MKGQDFFTFLRIGCDLKIKRTNHSFTKSPVVYLTDNASIFINSITKMKPPSKFCVESNVNIKFLPLLDCQVSPESLPLAAPLYQIEILMVVYPKHKVCINEDRLDTTGVREAGIRQGVYNILVKHQFCQY